MPLYDYKCGACEKVTEFLHGPDEVKKKCPECGKLQLRRVFTAPPAYHDHYSPMHPRAGRGRGGHRGLPNS